MSTDRLVDITVTFAPGVVEKLVCKAEDYECNALEKCLNSIQHKQLQICTCLMKKRN